MGYFRVTVYGRSREVYLVDAADAEEAQEVWVDYDPVVSEVDNTEVYEVEEVTYAD